MIFRGQGHPLAALKKEKEQKSLPLNKLESLLWSMVHSNERVVEATGVEPATSCVQTDSLSQCPFRTRQGSRLLPEYTLIRNLIKDSLSEASKNGHKKQG